MPRVTVELSEEVYARLWLYAVKRYGSYKRLSRAVEELLRSALSSVDESGARDGSLEARLTALEGEIALLREKLLKAEGERRGGGRTAVDILEREGFAFEPLLKLREPDAFFTRLRERGAVILELPGGRLAVSPQLWEQLRNALASSGPKAEKLAGDEKLRKLFRILAEQGAVLYDEAKGWLLPQR